MSMIVALSEGATVAIHESVKRYLENVWRLRERMIKRPIHLRV
jgi:hypothetical protein